MSMISSISKIEDLEFIGIEIKIRDMSEESSHLEEGELVESDEDDDNKYMEVSLKISNQQYCCEDFGFFICDNKGNSIKIEKLVGRKVLSIKEGYKVFDKELMDRYCLDGCQKKIAECNCQCCPVYLINLQLEDDKIVQLGVYNIQNGYYSHDVVAFMNNKKAEFML